LARPGLLPKEGAAIALGTICPLQILTGSVHGSHSPTYAPLTGSAEDIAKADRSNRANDFYLVIRARLDPAADGDLGMHKICGGLDVGSPLLRGEPRPSLPHR
jgi:hypothetical protein